MLTGIWTEGSQAYTQEHTHEEQSHFLKNMNNAQIQVNTETVHLDSTHIKKITLCFAIVIELMRFRTVWSYNSSEIPQ